MITKTDCLLILTEMKNNGIDTDIYTKKLLAEGLTLDVVKFINNNRGLDLCNFYEKIRKSYNNKKSTLYINIVKEVDDPTKVVSTLSALLTQVILFSDTVEDKQMFLNHARANDISKVLSLYFTNYDLSNCIKLLRLIKTDIKAFESFRK